MGWGGVERARTVWQEMGTVLRRPYAAGPRKNYGIRASVLVTRDHWRGEWKVPTVTFLGTGGVRAEAGEWHRSHGGDAPEAW